MENDVIAGVPSNQSLRPLNWRAAAEDCCKRNMSFLVLNDEEEIADLLSIVKIRTCK